MSSTFHNAKDRQYYEDLYDKHTVELCRNAEQGRYEAYQDYKQKLSDSEKQLEAADLLGLSLSMSRLFYHFTTYLIAGERWGKREDTIQEWMKRDAAKDQKLADARLSREPVCVHCRETGLRIISKDLMSRNNNGDADAEEEVVFMLSCPACGNNCAYWEDGTKWEKAKVPCLKCNSGMDTEHERSGNTITTTYTCSQCTHSFTDKMELGKSTEEDPNPDFERDRGRFCLSDEQGEQWQEEKRRMEGAKEVLEMMQERQDNKEVYEAIENIQKLTIPQLSELLKPAAENAGYTEFSIGKPNMGRYATVDFDCLDSNTERSDHDSRKALKKVIKQTLEDTNWRLTSAGISYRLGYLSGRMRAYETEEELKKLMAKNKKPH